MTLACNDNVHCSSDFIATRDAPVIELPQQTLFATGDAPVFELATGDAPVFGFATETLLYLILPRETLLYLNLPCGAS